MTNDVFDLEQIDRKSHLDQALDALDKGDVETARDQIRRAAKQSRSLKNYSISWIADLLSFIGENYGEASVEDALRQFGDRELADRADPDNDWWSVPAEVRAKVVTRAMLSNFGEVDVDADDEKIILSFQCGSGGWLINSGAYDGDDGLLTLTDKGPRTFGRDSLPVYCAHCSVNNEMQAVESTGRLSTVEHPPTRPGEPCVHHVYRDPSDIPDEVYLRIGERPPSDENTT
jgi:hypothetical protein